MKIHPLDRLALPTIDIAEMPIHADAEYSETRLTGVALPPLEAERVRIRDCVLDGLRLDNVRLERLHFTNVLGRSLSLTGTDCLEASWHRTDMTRSRLTGLKLTEALIEETTFTDCLLNLSLFRFAKLKKVRFVGCVLRGVDFSSAALKNVSFENCDLSEADFSRAFLQQVDLRSSILTGINGVLGLRGAIISTDQLIGLSYAMAAEIGISVQEPE